MQLYRFVALFIVVLSLVACSNEQANQAKETTKSEEGDRIEITDFSDRKIVFERAPENIVTLGSGETEIIYALGHEVVGRPSGKTIAEAEKELEVGSTHSIDLEKIISLEPDVVLGNEPMNRKDIQAIENIDAQLVLTSANSVADIKKQITLFGDMLHKQEKANDLLHTIDNTIAKLQKNTTENKRKVVMIYGAPGTNLVALPNSLGGDILELVGGLNIAHDYPRLEEYPQYAPLNTERIIEANPQLILLMTHGNPKEVEASFMKEISQAAGWDNLEAVKKNRVITLPSDLFGTNPGTKVVEALEYLHDVLQDVKE